MGYESCVLINHDYYSRIADDPARFIKDMWAAMNKATQQPQGFPGGVALFVDHASTLRLIVMGKRHGTVLAETNEDWSAAHHKGTQLALVRQAASVLGYRLVKKPVSKTANKTVRKSATKKNSEKAEGPLEEPAQQEE